MRSAKWWGAIGMDRFGLGIAGLRDSSFAGGLRVSGVIGDRMMFTK
jgi:hypothetical protein